MISAHGPAGLVHVRCFTAPWAMCGAPVVRTGRGLVVTCLACRALPPPVLDVAPQLQFTVPARVSSFMSFSARRHPGTTWRSATKVTGMLEAHACGLVVRTAWGTVVPLRRFYG